MTTFAARQAWLDGELVDGVLIAVENGIITEVSSGGRCATAKRLEGVVLPGFVNVHSHAFHRALRGVGGAHGSFSSWRKQMYALAQRLDPDLYYRLARAVYAEMVLAGFTAVGEFHYLHHGPGGTRYSNPNAMSQALDAAAADAGIRLTLIDTCYLSGGIAIEPSGAQLRFCDGDATGWADRVACFTPETATVAAAVHSVRAVPREALPEVAAFAADAGMALHVHLSEHPAENEQCHAAYGCSPTRLLADAGALSRRAVAVHATHVDDADIAALAAAGTGVCLCPTTERDLGDGLGPARAFADAGLALSIGSDGQSVIDPFAELAALEANERLRTGRRGVFDAHELLAAGAGGIRLAGAGGIRPGAECMGAGISPGAVADLVVCELTGIAAAGVPVTGDGLLAGATRVTGVLVGGDPVVLDGVHQRIADPVGELAAAIAAVRR